jgi:hypothetical protein
MILTDKTNPETINVRPWYRICFNHGLSETSQGQLKRVARFGRLKSECKALLGKKQQVAIVIVRRRRGKSNSRTAASGTTEGTMSPGDSLKTVKPIRSQKTGVLLPREGTFVRAVENLGRNLILVNFGTAGEEYLFPHEVLMEPSKG